MWFQRISVTWLSAFSIYSRMIYYSYKTEQVCSIFIIGVNEKITSINAYCFIIVIMTWGLSRGIFICFLFIKQKTASQSSEEFYPCQAHFPLDILKYNIFSFNHTMWHKIKKCMPILLLKLLFLRIGKLHFIYHLLIGLILLVKVN